MFNNLLKSIILKNNMGHCCPPAFLIYKKLITHLFLLNLLSMLIFKIMGK
jgi:hypothetical protein